MGSLIILLNLLFFLEYCAAVHFNIIYLNCILFYFRDAGHVIEDSSATD